MAAVRMSFLTSLLVLTLANVCTGGQAGRCPGRAVHLTSGGKDFHFSWKEHPDKVFSWTEGRKYCKEICMDLVSLETKDDWETVLEIIKKGNLCLLGFMLTYFISSCSAKKSIIFLTIPSVSFRACTELWN